MFSKYKYLIVNLVFPTSVFGLVAPFPDHFLLVPLYYTSVFFNENECADQLCNYCTADLRLCFRLSNLFVSRRGSNVFKRMTPTCRKFNINPLMTNGFTHRYHLGESTFIFRGIRGDF